MDALIVRFFFNSEVINDRNNMHYVGGKGGTIIYSVIRYHCERLLSIKGFVQFKIALSRIGFFLGKI